MSSYQPSQDTEEALQFLPHLDRIALKLEHEILAHARSQEIAQIRQRAHLHLALRVPALRAHVREKRHLREVEEARVDLRLVREHVQAGGGDL